jgi:hypothetical protein
VLSIDARSAGSSTTHTRCALRGVVAADLQGDCAVRLKLLAQPDVRAQAQDGWAGSLGPLPGREQE